MTADNWLFVFILALFGFTGWMIATAPEISDEDRKEMEDEGL